MMWILFDCKGNVWKGEGGRVEREQEDVCRVDMLGGGLCSRLVVFFFIFALTEFIFFFFRIQVTNLAQTVTMVAKSLGRESALSKNN